MTSTVQDDQVSSVSEEHEHTWVAVDLDQDHEPGTYYKCACGASKRE